MVHDQPRIVDLTEAGGPTQPESGLLPSVHGSAYPVEAVGEGTVIAHRDGEVVNFIADRTLERREDLFPNFPEGICSYVAQRGHDVERHDLPKMRSSIGTKSFHRAFTSFPADGSWSERLPGWGSIDG